MAASDFLFSIGANAADANAAVDDFVKRTRAALQSINQVQLNMGGAVSAQENLLRVAQQRLSVEQQIASVRASNARASSGSGSSGGSSGGYSGSGMKDITGIARANTAAIGQQKDAFDMLGRIMGNTVFKFVEYELIMKAFNGAVGEVFNSLNQASQVQMEQVLQHIYDKTLDTNAALKDAIIIAKQWGSDITDVQQVIGLWTKQTSEMHDATGKLVDSQTALAAAAKLAADAEKFHAATGIDSLEVYRMTVATWHQLGMTLEQVPGLYDQIAYAATKISPVLKNMGGTGSSQEAAKDIFEALSKSAATLKSQGLDASGVIAVVAEQIETLGANGSEVGRSLSTLFGSLNQGGKALREWTSILGPDAFKDQDTFFAAITSHVQELEKATANGDLHVKPQVIDAWRTILETAKQTAALATDIQLHSKGVLNIIADAQMETYQGQVNRLKASFQELNLALGTQLLPTATHFISFLSGTMMPILSANATTLAKVAQAAIQLGGAYLGLLGIARVQSAMAGLRGEMAAGIIVGEQYEIAQLGTVSGMNAAAAQMEREQAALAQLEAQLKVASWQLGDFQAKCAALGVTEGEVAAITEGKLVNGFEAAGSAAVAFGAKIAATMGPLIAVYGIIQLLSSAVGAFDQRSNMVNNLNEHLLGQGTWQGRLESVPNIGGHMQQGFSSLFGRDKGAMTQFNNLAQGDPELEKLYSEFKASKDTAHQDSLREQILLKAGADYDSKNMKNVKGYDSLDQLPPWLKKAMESASGGTPSGYVAPDNSGSGSGKTKQATEQQIAAEAVNKDKADAMAQISEYRDIEDAAASYIETLQKVGEAHGFTENTVKALTAAYNTEANAIQKGKEATQREITDLQKQKSDLEELIRKHGAAIDAQGNVTNRGDKSSAIYAEAKAWRMADEAITKATGNLDLYESKQAKLDSSKPQDEAQAWAAIAKATSNQGGLQSIGGSSTGQHLGFLNFSLQGSQSGGGSPLSSPDNAKAYFEQLSQSLETATNNTKKFNVAASQVDALKALGAQVESLYVSLEKTNPAAAKFAGQVLAQIDQAGAAATKTMQSSGESLSQFNTKLQDMFTSLAGQNATSFGKLFGIDAESLSSQKQLLDGYSQMNDELTQMQKLIQENGGTYQGLDATQKSLVQGVIQQVQVQQQLLPLLQQQLQLQDSIAFKATEAALQKAGEAVLDADINRLMGQGNTAASREQQYKASVNGTAMSGIQSIFKDYLSSVVTQWWSQTVKQLTNTMFGGTDAQKLQANEVANQKALQAIVTDTKNNVVAKLVAFGNQFAQSATKIANAAQSSSGSGSGSGGGWGNDGGSAGNNGDSGGGWGSDNASAGTQSNPLVVNTVGDGTQGLFSDPTSQQNMADAFTTGLNASDMAASTASMDANIADGAKIAQQAVNNAAGTGAGTATPGSIADGGGLPGLLGPLQGLLQKDLGGANGQGTATGSALGGAMQGYGIGEMIGGAGSTNGDWGAIGGGIGGAAGFLFGGPAGAAVGSTIGGILGGLFGFHPNPSDEPDVFDTQNYGQFVTNINGAPGTFNGTTIDPQPQFDKADGNQGMGAQMLAWAQSNPNDPLAKQILALGTNLGISSEKQGIFTLGSGKTISVTAYESLGQQWLAKAGNQVNAPIISVSSYGGGSAKGSYNTPGMTSAEFLSSEQGWAAGQGGSASSYGGGAPVVSGSGGGAGGGAATSATSTPGYGGSTASGTFTLTGPNGGSGQLLVQVNTPVYLDGKAIAMIVNAYNADLDSRSGNLNR